MWRCNQGPTVEKERLKSASRNISHQDLRELWEKYTDAADHLPPQNESDSKEVVEEFFVAFQVRICFPCPNFQLYMFKLLFLPSRE